MQHRVHATLPWTDLDAVVAAVTARATNLGSQIHGPVHWHSVARASLYLLDAGERGDRPLVFLFALLHDAMREDDGYDYGHGPRAAELFDDLRDCGLLLMDRTRAACLHAALHDHAFGETSEDPTVGLCWDSDRLDLGRVGIAPNPAFLSTATAKRLASAGAPLRWARAAADWHTVAASFDLYRPEAPPGT